MSSRSETTVSTILAICAVLIAGATVHREFADSEKPRVATIPTAAPSFDSSWRDIVPAGIRIGAVTAPITIIEFADFECPFCARFQSTLDEVRKESPDEISVVFVHFPLPQHRFARPAARAAECADRQHHFGQMSTQLFAEQNSFGLKPWAEYAATAGVPDTVLFSKCMREVLEPLRIEEGSRRGQKLHLEGTPTVFINGWRYAQPPSPELLRKIVAAVKQGKSLASLSP